MRLTARHLEANGIPTLILGSAIDIVEHCKVPRYVHVDFPLGNPCGKPFDEAMQLDIAEQALQIFAEAKKPGTTVRLPHRWSEDETWRDGYARVDESNVEALRKMGEQRRKEQEEAKARGVSLLNQIT